MGLAFLSGFATGLGQGLDEFNKAEERREQRQIQVAQADRTAQQNRDKLETAWGNSFLKASKAITDKQEKLKSPDSKLSAEVRKNEFQKTVDAMNELISSSGSIAGEKGYTSFGSLAEPLIAGGATSGYTDINGWGVPSELKPEVDAGSIRIGNSGQILVPKTTTNSRGNIVEELDDQGNTIFEPSGQTVNKMNDIFPTQTPEFKNFKVYLRNSKGKVVSNIEVTSAAQFASIKEGAQRDGYTMHHGQGKDIDITTFTGYSPTGTVVNYNSQEELDKAVQSGAVMLEPRGFSYLSSQAMLNDKENNLYDFYKEGYGEGWGFSAEDAGKMHFILRKTSTLQDKQIKDLMFRLKDAEWFGKGIDLSKIEEDDNFTAQEKIYLRDMLQYTSGERVIVTLSERTKDGNMESKNVLWTLKKAMAFKEKHKDNKNAGVEWENMIIEEEPEKKNKDANLIETMNPQDKKYYYSELMKYKNELKKAVGKEGREKVQKDWDSKVKMLKQAYGVK